MSGKRQHYLPQFVLRRFGKSSTAKAIQVRVVRPTRSYVSSTEKVGLELYFYGKGESDYPRLDEDITVLEGRLSAIAASAINNSESVSERDMCELASHLSIRSASIRRVVPHLMREITQEVLNQVRTEAGAKQFIGLDSGLIPAEIKSRISGWYDNERELFRQKGISRHDFYRICRQNIENNFATLHESILSTISALSDLSFDQIVSQGQLNALAESPVPLPRLGYLRSLRWNMLITEKDLILPDCAVVGVDENGSAMPMVFLGNDELRGVLLPLSRNHLVVGYHASGFEVGDDIIMSIASASCEYFVAHPDFEGALSYASAIGVGAKHFLRRELRRGIAEVLPASAR